MTIPNHLFSRRRLLQTLAVSAGVPGSGAASAEWTLEAAMKEWPPMRKPIQHVGVPGHEWQTGVYWDGSLLCGPTLLRGEMYMHPLMVEETAALGDSLLHLSIGYGEPMRLVDRLRDCLSGDRIRAERSESHARDPTARRKGH